MAVEKKMEHLEKYKKLQEKAGKLVETTNLEHRNAYNNAVDDLLKDKDGLVDYKKLDDNEIQLAFADKMAEHYLKKGKKALGAKPKDEFENALLTKAYAGVTKAELRHHVGQYKKDFKFDFFDQKLRPALMKNIQATLYSTAGMHLTEKHIGDIVEYTGVKKIKDFVPDYLTRSSALRILDHYHQKEEDVTRKDIENLIEMPEEEGGLPKQLLKKKKKKS